MTFDSPKLRKYALYGAGGFALIFGGYFLYGKIKAHNATAQANAQANAQAALDQQAYQNAVSQSQLSGLFGGFGGAGGGTVNPPANNPAPASASAPTGNTTDTGTQTVTTSSNGLTIVTPDTTQNSSATNSLIASSLTHAQTTNPNSFLTTTIHGVS